MTTPPQHTRPRRQRLKSPPRPRKRSPTPSPTSIFACSSNDIPTTPLTSDDDDEWSGLSPSPSPQLRKAPAAQRGQIHQLVISKTAPPNASSVTALEFHACDPEGERTDEAEMSWYARDLGQVVSLATSPCTPSGSGGRPRADSLSPPPPSPGSGKRPRTRMSKHLPALPGPHPQLDPTFPRRLRQPLPPSVPSTTTTTTSSVRKSFEITVPRAAVHTAPAGRLRLSDVFDDIDASIFLPSSGPRSTDPSTSHSSTSFGAGLSPSRIPETPMRAYSAYDPIELIIDYATQPSPLLTSFLPGYDSGGDKDDDDESWPTEEKLRSRWSCLTIGTLTAGANAKTPTSPSASEKLRFHLGSVAPCRAGGDEDSRALIERADCRSQG